jgi:hypothetical protein
MKIKFRPHHFLCALCFEGKGYSNKFVKNFSDIVAHLRSENGDDAVIEVVYDLDSVCKVCPHNLGDKCDSQPKIDTLDTHHREILNLKDGEKITWKEAKKRIKQHMTVEKHHAACASCEWLKYGMCEKHLRDLHNTD